MNTGDSIIFAKFCDKKNGTVFCTHRCAGLSKKNRSVYRSGFRTGNTTQIRLMVYLEAGPVLAGNYYSFW